MSVTSVRSQVFHTIQYEPLVNVLSQILCSTHDELLDVVNKRGPFLLQPKLIQPKQSIIEFFSRRSSGKLRDPSKSYTFEDLTAAVEMSSKKPSPNVSSALLEVPPIGEAVGAAASSSSNVSESESDFDFGSIDQLSFATDASNSASRLSTSLSNQNMGLLENTLVSSPGDQSASSTSLMAPKVQYSPTLLPPSPVLQDPITAAVVNVIQSSGDECDTFPGPKYISVADRLLHHSLISR